MVWTSWVSQDGIKPDPGILWVRPAGPDVIEESFIVTPDPGGFDWLARPGPLPVRVEYPWSLETSVYFQGADSQHIQDESRTFQRSLAIHMSLLRSPVSRPCLVFLVRAIAEYPTPEGVVVVVSLVLVL